MLIKLETPQVSAPAAEALPWEGHSSQGRRGGLP